jgi:flagella basal body P-ring formation protein FlgA
VALAAALAAPWLAAGPALTPPVDVVRAAIADAVRSRVGPDADVEVTTMKASITSLPEAIAALPAPGARTGRPVRFTLVPGGAGGLPAARRRPIGYAVAIVRLTTESVRAARDLAPGTVLTATDVTTVRAEVVGVPMARLPSLAEIVEARVRREVRSGETLTSAVVHPQPLVRAGDWVTTRARIGRVDVTSRALAQQSGGRGDAIRLFNPESRTVLRGRVTARKEVSVLYEP